MLQGINLLIERVMSVLRIIRIIRLIRVVKLYKNMVNTRLIMQRGEEKKAKELEKNLRVLNREVTVKDLELGNIEKPLSTLKQENITDENKIRKSRLSDLALKFIQLPLANHINGAEESKNHNDSPEKKPKKDEEEYEVRPEPISRVRAFFTSDEPLTKPSSDKYIPTNTNQPTNDLPLAKYTSEEPLSKQISGERTKNKGKVIDSILPKLKMSPINDIDQKNQNLAIDRQDTIQETCRGLVPIEEKPKIQNFKTKAGAISKQRRSSEYDLIERISLFKQERKNGII